LEFFFEIRVGNVLKFLMKKKSGQNDDFNPFKSAPKAERANITARANNTAPMVDTSSVADPDPPGSETYYLPGSGSGFVIT